MTYFLEVEVMTLYSQFFFTKYQKPIQIKTNAVFLKGKELNQQVVFIQACFFIRNLFFFKGLISKFEIEFVLTLLTDILSYILVFYYLLLVSIQILF